MNWTKVFFLLLTFFVTTGLMPVFGEEPDPDSDVTKLDEMVVKERPPEEIVGETFTGIDATSGTILSNERIVDRVYATPLDMLKLSPGVNVLQFNQGGVPRGLQMRGFPWVSHSSDGAIYLDGVDLYGGGGSDTNEIIPEEVERVEIIKGPASALYGNHASAGSIHFHTYEKEDFTRLKLRYGSYKTQDGTAVIAQTDDKLDQVYAGQIYHTDGYQDFSTWDKYIGSGRWTYHFTDHLDTSFAVRTYHSTWDAPGTIPEAWYESEPTRALNDVNGGWKERNRVQAGLKYKFSNGSKLSLLGYHVGQEYGRWTQSYTSSDKDVGDINGNTYQLDFEAKGMTLAYNYIGKILQRESRLDLGVDWRRDDETKRYWRLLEGYGRTRGAMYTNDEATFDTTSVYGEMNYQVIEKLRLILGSRYDMFSGTLDRLDGSSYDKDGPDIYSPKAGLVFSPVNRLEVYANYGKGFSLPSTTDYNSRDYLDPAIRTQYELGVRFLPSDWWDASLTAWRLDTTDDYQPSMSDPSIQENAGETRRQGIEMDANARLWSYLQLHLDYAYTDTEYLNFYNGGVRYDGNELRFTPNHIVNAEIAWQPAAGLGGRLGYRYQSSAYIDYATTMEMSSFSVCNAQVSYRFNQRYRLALDVMNLFDTKYAEYVGYTSGSKVYTPGDPISAYLSLTIDL